MGNNSGIRCGEDSLQEKGKQKLVSDVLDIVNKGGHDPTSDNPRDIGGDRDVTNLNYIVGEHEQGALVSKCNHGLPNHTTDKQDNKIYCKLPIHGKQLAWEKRLLGDSKVVDERSDKDTCPYRYS